MRNGFKTLLESVQKQCPELITEEVFSDMMTQFDDGIAQIQADATADGQALGFREGYDEGKRVAAEQAKAELAALTEKLDQEAVEKITSILEMIDENHTAKLQELYDFMQNNMVEKSELDAAIADKEAALAAQDEDYAEKFETAMTAVCDDHACKLQQYSDAVNDNYTNKLKLAEEALDKKYQKILTESVEKIDLDNTAKLKEVVKLLNEDKAKAVAETKAAGEKLIAEAKEAGEKALAAEKAKKVSILAEGVEKYLNYALEQYMPKSQLISEAKYNAAIKTLDKVTDLLKVNTIIQESKEGIFQEYETKIAEAKEEQNKLINETIELKAMLNKKEAQLLLESKAQKCTPAEARFLRGYFKDAATPAVIEESLEAAHAAWKKIQTEHRQVLKDSLKKEVTQEPSKVITESKKQEVKEPVKEVISEEKEEAQKETKLSLVDFYASCLK
mgnify:FL=1